MDSDLSTLELPRLVEHMQGDVALMRQRIIQAGPLSPADRVAAAQYIKTLAATLGNLHRILGHGTSERTIPGEAHGRT